jgi:hypothetical protein
VDIVAIPIKGPVATTGLFLFKKPAATLAFFFSICWLNELFATEQVNASDPTQILYKNQFSYKLKYSINYAE